MAKLPACFSERGNCEKMTKKYQPVFQSVEMKKNDQNYKNGQKISCLFFRARI